MPLVNQVVAYVICSASACDCWHIESTGRGGPLAWDSLTAALATLIRSWGCTSKSLPKSLQGQWSNHETNGLSASLRWNMIELNLLIWVSLKTTPLLQIPGKSGNLAAPKLSLCLGARPLPNTAARITTYGESGTRWYLLNGFSLAPSSQELCQGEPDETFFSNRFGFTSRVAVGLFFVSGCQNILGVGWLHISFGLSKQLLYLARQETLWSASNSME